jgi:hypothetical protein
VARGNMPLPPLSAALIKRHPTKFKFAKKVDIFPSQPNCGKMVDLILKLTLNPIWKQNFLQFLCSYVFPSLAISLQNALKVKVENMNYLSTLKLTESLNYVTISMLSVIQVHS